MTWTSPYFQILTLKLLLLTVFSLFIEHFLIDWLQYILSLPRKRIPCIIYSYMLFPFLFNYMCNWLIINARFKVIDTCHWFNVNHVKVVRNLNTFSLFDFQLTVFLPFFVNLQLPYSVVRGELAVIQANVFNYRDQDHYVSTPLIQNNCSTEYIHI